jgi:hypothetical protein
MDLPGQPTALGQRRRLGAGALTGPQLGQQYLGLPMSGPGPLFREPGGPHEREDEH